VRLTLYTTSLELIIILFVHIHVQSATGESQTFVRLQLVGKKNCYINVLVQLS